MGDPNVHHVYAVTLNHLGATSVRFFQEAAGNMAAVEQADK
jgi:hypothetical protein